MARTVTQTPKTPTNDDYLTALSKWEACKPPYAGSHIQTCVTAAKIILNRDNKPRRTKYEKENYLRIDFSKAGKVTFYAEFPKSMSLRGQKLGEWPEMSITIAREKASEMAAGGLRAESVHQISEEYRQMLAAKVARGKLGENSLSTYEARINQIEKAFTDREVFSYVQYNRLIEVLEIWIETKTANNALELFAELRRLWKYAAPLYSNGKNIAASIPDDYVSSRVVRPTPTRRYTDIDSLAQLWINIASASSLHQKNAVRYMILTGVRPVNVSNLRREYITPDLTEIVYPADAMKTPKEFRIPVTAGLLRILKEQLAWQDAAEDCNKDFVFLQPRDPKKPFAKRSLDKLVKDYSPENCVKGVIHDATIKGRSGAFNTMCRKFLKSNVIAQMRLKDFSRSDARTISKMCMHHSDNNDDPMAEHYDFSEEILQEEMSLKKIAFTSHEDSILARVALLRKK